MSARNAYRVPGRREGGPQGDRNDDRAHWGGPGRFGVRPEQVRNNDRLAAAASKDNTEKLGARLDLVVLMYCE